MRNCTCVGSCRGASGLGRGWVCALEAEVKQATASSPDEELERRNRDVEINGVSYGGHYSTPRRDHVECVMLNRAELDQVLTILRDSSRSGVYYGEKFRYRNRADRIWHKFEAAYCRLTGATGYPLKPSKV